MNVEQKATLLTFKLNIIYIRHKCVELTGKLAKKNYSDYRYCIALLKIKINNFICRK